MYETQLLDYLPLWGGYLAMVAVFLVAAEGGYRLAGYRLHRKDVGQTSQAGAIMGATLGLLAFMLAFTFGMGASRFDTRKQLVLDEANAVRTAYLRSAGEDGSAGALNGTHRNSPGTASPALAAAAVDLADPPGSRQLVGMVRRSHFDLGT
jgi:hypothetical protein